MVDSTPKFVLVKSVSPFNDGRFGRAGLRFTREWRSLQVAQVADLDRGIITKEILRRLEAEQMLAVKPASESEIAELVARAGEPKDDKARVAELEAKNADLEARLMKLELGAKSGTTGTAGTTPGSEADKRTGLGDKDEIEATETDAAGKTQLGIGKGKSK